MEPITKFNVRNQNISRIDNFYVVAKSKSYLTAEFSFLTPDWQGVTKTAIFHDKDTSYTQILTDDKCEVPWEWLANAGTEPSVSLKMFKGRAFTIHVKDYAIHRLEGKIEDVPFFFAPVGMGNLNWEGILKTADEIGIERFVVEQDNCIGDVFDEIKISYDNLVKMGLK